METMAFRGSSFGTFFYDSRKQAFPNKIKSIEIYVGKAGGTEHDCIFSIIFGSQKTGQ